MIKFGYTKLHVSNVSKSMAFYENAFGFIAKFITPGGSYGELETGQTTLAFSTFSNQSSKVFTLTTKDPNFIQTPTIELILVTKEVNAVVDRAKQCGATIIEEPTIKTWGQTVAYLKDIDGFLIEICSPM